MTQEQIDLIVNNQIKLMKKQLVNTLKKDEWSLGTKQKKIKAIAKESADNICKAIEVDQNKLTEQLISEGSTAEKKELVVEPAIDVSNLWIRYKTLKSYSVKKMLLKRESNKNEKGFAAVRGVNFTINKGEIWGIIGKNGSGKSTMLRAIAGIFSPDEGSVDLHNHTISLLSIGVGFKNELSGRENILLSGMLLGFPEEMIHEKMDEIIEFSELGEFIDYPVRTYSSGMYSKLAFSITASLETDIILIDEVLSVGDEKFRKKSMNRMKELINNDERTVVIVSHSITTLKELCDKMIWLHEGEIKMIGETNEVLVAYQKFMK
ncbi:Teichoic acid export ATP-binding protein TagH [Lachnospiraceae bacterium TWA4]|nr:Teichoic acid export ATP-binding protein TagH [Lachnospiraceae bacterium TWA4]